MDFLSRNTIFDEPFDIFGHSDPVHSDFYENGNEYVLEIDLPGYKKENMKLHYENGYLNIYANQEETGESVTYFRKERYRGNYQRSFYVGPIDNKKMKATYQNGILTIHLPKIDPPAQEKNIKID